MTPFDAASAALPQAAAPRAIIAIPAHDEAARLPACLGALGAQHQLGGYGETAVLVLANNCSDDTAGIARSLAPTLPFRLLVQECRLPPALAHAGGARRTAMEAAAALAGPRTTLLCTDADARPEPGWLAANLAGLAAGADAVAGTIRLDPAEAALLPPTLRRREALEASYAARLEALAALLDPLAHDPWPRHGTHSGASIALTLDAYRAIGGVPAVPVGEDRALFAALARLDARIRHCPAARVVVSCRLDGRAAGGMAETMRRRLDDPEAPLDARLEAAVPALLRLRCRRLLRRLRSGEAPLRGTGWLAMALGIMPQALRAALEAPGFGLAWDALEAAAPLLRRRPLRPAALPQEIARAEAMLRLYGPAISPEPPADAGCRAGMPQLAPAG